MDPILKILHIPSDGIAIVSAIGNPQAQNRGMIALLFAVFYGAVTTMSPAAVKAILGQDKARVLSLWGQCIEAAVCMADTLSNPGLRTLQALTIYLASFLFT
jgi:hypothetical protein